MQFIVDLLHTTGLPFMSHENMRLLMCLILWKCQIERIQNPALYKQYVIRKTEMEKANPMVQNERTLWHGTSVDTVPSINDTGFNRSYCGKNGKDCTCSLYVLVLVGCVVQW